jgi:hypothetical protein
MQLCAPKEAATRYTHTHTHTFDMAQARMVARSLMSFALRSRTMHTYNLQNKKTGGELYSRSSRIFSF